MNSKDIKNGIFNIVNKKRYIWLCILFKALIDWSYYILSDSAFKIQFHLDFNFTKYVVSYILLFLLSYELSKSGKVSGFFLRFLNFICIIPISCVYGMADESTVFFGGVYICFFLVVVLTRKYRILLGSYVILDSKSNLDMYANGYQDERISIIAKGINVICFLVGGLVVVLMYLKNGVPTLSAFIFSKVYEIRSQYISSSYLNYVITVVTGIIVPIEIAFGMQNKKKLQVIFFSTIQVMLFLWTGNKIYLFSMLLIYAVFIIVKLNISIDTIYIGMIGVAIAGNLSSIVENTFSDAFFSFFNRRMILDSATLKYFYYDYFIVNNHPKSLFAGTLLAPIFGSGNTEDFRTIIAESYTGYSSSANTGLFGGDIACIGIGAVTIVPFLLILTIILIEQTYKYFGAYFTLIMYIYIIYRFNEICIYTFYMDFSGLLLILFTLLYKKIRKGHL